MPIMNMVESLNLALFQEMSRDSNVIVLGEDVGIDGGVFRVTDGLLKKFGNQRVIDTPLAETAIVGSAIGMAIAGLRPIVEIQFSGFIYSTIDQLINHASRIRNRSRGTFNCPIVVRTPYSGGIKALEHHSESMESLFIHIPGLKVVIPSSPFEAKGLLASAIRDPDPVIFYEPTRVYRAIKEDVPTEQYTVPLGQSKIVQEGSDVTLISYGAMLRETKNAVSQISNVSCEIIDLRTLSPLDTTTIINSVKKTGRVIIVHEAPKTLGIGAEISAVINEKALLSLEAPVERVTGYDTVIPLAKLELEYLPSQKRIIKAIEKVMNF